MTLRSRDDAARLRQGLQGCRRTAIVGGGWIGLEIAASARRLGIEVTVFERQPALCMRSVGADVSQALLELHRQQGVTVLCGCGEISLEDRDGAARVGSEVSDPQAFDLVVVGIGVELNLELARSAGLAIESGIVVDGGAHQPSGDLRRRRCGAPPDARPVPAVTGLRAKSGHQHRLRDARRLRRPV